jgi:lipopolysaccharide/colanic/teichoic acid biosynthesis glycosyltransferase
MWNEGGRASKVGLVRIFWIRRIGDVIVAGILLAITAPLLCLVGIAILLSASGPIFIKQQRIGAAGRWINVLRFRTIAQDHRSSNRMTKVGRFLHWTRIEELPQLINVMRGELSLFDTAVNRPDFFD